MKVLVVKSSVTGDGSFSNKKIDSLVEQYKEKGWEVVIRDVAKNPVPLFDANLMSGFRGNPEFAKDVQHHNDLIDEVLSVDEIVLGAPMYNFSIPVQLKAYLDAISRSGKTFKYTENGPVGLLSAKKAVIVSSRGGFYHNNGFTNQEDYLKTVLSFLGVQEKELVLIEGTAMGENKESTHTL